MTASGSPPFLKTKVSLSQKAGLKQRLYQLPGIRWQEKPEQYCDYRLDGQSSQGWVRVKQYTNGTFYAQSVSQSLLDQLAGQLNLPTNTVTKSASGQRSSTAPLQKAIEGPYIGTDESGKGDYFGPLVVAGVYADEATLKALENLGVTDSKTLNAKQITQLAHSIEHIVGPKGYAIVTWLPETYNAQYQQYVSRGKNLNHLLADSHARVIAPLLNQHTDCTQVVVDQFGKETYVSQVLKDTLPAERYRSVSLHQTPKAEAYTAVAAASILARHHFVDALNTLSQTFGMDLPLGAGSPVLAAGKRWVREKGRDSLVQVAKWHFKTTQQL